MRRFIGSYGHGLTESATALQVNGNQQAAPAAGPVVLTGQFGTKDFDVAKATASGAPLPTPAGPPPLDELNGLLAKLGTVPTLKTLAPSVVALPDDWRTQGDWLGRYGRYWACCCAICSPQNYVWGMGKRRFCTMRKFAQTIPTQTTPFVIGYIGYTRPTGAPSKCRLHILIVV